MKKRSTRRMINEMNLYLKGMIQSVLIFEDGLKYYLEDNEEDFLRHVKKIDDIESELDKLRKEIEYHLYSRMLIPESRGDILGLLENMDDVVNTEKFILISIEIERPEIPDWLHQLFQDMTERSRLAVEALVESAENYLTNHRNPEKLTEKVFYYEHEIDKLEWEAKRKVFQSDLDKAEKLHLKDFIAKISRLSDCCESVAERIIISSFKREI